MQLDTIQINNLCTGVKLATELKSSNPNLRKFLTIQGYSYDADGEIIGLENILKNSNINTIYFELRCYKISIEYYDNHWDVTEDDLSSQIYHDDIKGIAALESELKEYIDDYSVLKPEWYCENLL